MKKITFCFVVLVVVLAGIACEEDFKEAPITGCLSLDTAGILLSEETTCPTRAFFVSRTSDILVTDLQMFFACAGIKYGYDAKVEATTPDILAVTISSKEESADKAHCVCCKRMTVTYQESGTEIEKITHMQVSGDDWQMDPIAIETP